jgi:hypothetical protein
MINRARTSNKQLAALCPEDAAQRLLLKVGKSYLSTLRHIMKIEHFISQEEFTDVILYPKDSGSRSL